MLDIPTIAVKSINVLYKIKVLDSAGNVQYWVWGALCIIVGSLLLGSAILDARKEQKIRESS